MVVSLLMTWGELQQVDKVVILTSSISLGKTIQAITRMVEGRINKAGREAGFAKTTL